MSRRRFPWDRLGIDQTTDTAAIRKAYADALRATNVDEDIGGYAELRRARDQALWFAANAARAEEEEEDDLGLGSLDDDPEADEDDWLGDDSLWDDDDPFDDTPRPYRHGAFAPAPDPELSAAQVEAQAAWSRLLAILYPDGEPSEEAMIQAEADEGLAALSTLIARAEAADLAEHDALDGALAELFARTWPRSAPFVDPAAEAFHWLDEAGALEERPALRFLNQRLKGMRFHEKVQQPDHPLHKAWTELSRPGSVGVIDRLRVKRADVHKLIDGIRRNFPELESYLDPQRVGSWDAERPEQGAPGIVPRIVRGVFIVMLVLAVPRMIAQWTEREDASPPVVMLSDADINAKVAEVFGPGTNMKAVRAADPVFADKLLANIRVGNNQFVKPIDLVRLLALAAGEGAPRDALIARAQLKALWITAAQRQSDQLCRRVLRGDLRDIGFPFSPEERLREQALLRALLDAKQLNYDRDGGEYRYSIPGWLVEDTIKRSGLSEQALVAAFKDPDSLDRCKAELALVQAVIAKPSKVPEDVLRGL